MISPKTIEFSLLRKTSKMRVSYFFNCFFRMFISKSFANDISFYLSNCFRRVFHSCMMERYMIANSKDNKIFNSIIKSITIYMMNVFLGFKFTTKMFLHNQSVFWKSLVVNLKNTISILRNSSFSCLSFYSNKIRRAKVSMIMFRTKSLTMGDIVASINRACFSCHRIYCSKEVA